MANCVFINGAGSVVSADPQPSEINTCTYVLMTPVEFSQVSQVPDTTLAAQFFSFGFFMVVASFLGGWAVGSVLKIVRRGH
jgi:hypothetical protein